MAVETLTINGRLYTIAELEALLGLLEPPYDTAELQVLIEESNQDSSNELATLLGALAVMSLAFALLPRRRLTYVGREQSYFRGRQQLSEGELRQIIFAEQQRNAMRFRRRTQQLIDGRISLESWQDAMSRDIIRSHFRMAQAGAGTASRMNERHLRQLRNNLRDELSYFRQFADDLANGRTSEKMALYRAGRYGNSSGSSFHEARHVSHGDGRWLAWRRLDPTADHCPDCPGLATNGWVDASQVVPVGMRCRCRGNCRCQVQYRRVNLSDRLPIG